MQYKNQLNYIKNSGGFSNVKFLCEKNMDRIDNLHKSMQQSFTTRIEREKQNLRYLSDTIDNNNPINNLKKGYSLIFKDDEPLKAQAKLRKNDKITVRTETQLLSCTVDSTKVVRQKGKI